MEVIVKRGPRLQLLKGTRRELGWVNPKQLQMHSEMFNYSP